MITGTYNLIADPSWALTQLQEVRLECDTTLSAVTINLPAISTLAISTNLKLIVVDVTANASVNNITINAGATGLPPVSDTFDDSTTNQIILDTNGSSVIFQNVAATQWIATESVSSGGTLPTIKGTIMNVTPSETIAAQIPRFFVTGIFLIDPPIIHTGTTNETILSTQFIKGNTFRVGDFIGDSNLFSFTCQTINSSGTPIVFNVYQNTTPDLLGTPLLVSTYTDSFSGNNKQNVKVPYLGSGSAAIFTSQTNLKVVEDGNYPVTYSNQPFGDITVDSYFILTCTLTNALDSSVVYSQGTQGFIGRGAN